MVQFGFIFNFLLFTAQGQLRVYSLKLYSPAIYPIIYSDQYFTFVWRNKYMNDYIGLHYIMSFSFHYYFSTIQKLKDAVSRRVYCR